MGAAVNVSLSGSPWGSRDSLLLHGIVRVARTGDPCSVGRKGGREFGQVGWRRNRDFLNIALVVGRKERRKGGSCFPAEIYSVRDSEESPNVVP
jgi:hypothetical protein